MLIMWLVIMAIMIIVELCTTGITAIWIAGGAALAAILAALSLPVWVQCIVFVLATLVFMAFVRPIARKAFKKNRVTMNGAQFIGKRGMVVSEIDNLRGIGSVSINGHEWGARSCEENVIVPEGAIVNVVGVRGMRLVVELDDSMINNIDLKESDARLDPRYIERSGSYRED